MTGVGTDSCGLCWLGQKPLVLSLKALNNAVQEAAIVTKSLDCREEERPQNRSEGVPEQAKLV
jgi:hypothetical protein